MYVHVTVLGDGGDDQQSSEDGVFKENLVGVNDAASMDYDAASMDC